MYLSRNCWVRAGMSGQRIQLWTERRNLNDLANVPAPATLRAPPTQQL